MPRRAPAIFPLILWLTATMFLGGDLGRWNDDYEFNQRVPETGQFDRLSEPMEGQFWRPLFFTIVPALQTLLWDHAWINHLIQALAHAGTTALLWLLLRTLGIARGTSTALALLFLTCPITFQALFWSASLPTILSAAAYIAVALLYLRYARGEPTAWTVPAMLVAGVLIPLLNEQPAPALAALILLHPICARGSDRSSSRVMHALAPLGILAGLCALYLSLYLSTTPPGHPASASTLVHADQLKPRAASFLRHALECLRMGGRWDWFFRTGVTEMAARAWWGGACALALALSAAAWVRWRARDGATDEPVPGSPGATRTALFGLAVFTLAWSPIFFITTYEPASRLFYMPFIGLVCTAGALFDSLAARLKPARSTRRAAWAAVACASIGGSVCLVGAQSGFRTGHSTDESYARQLRTLVPDPAPGAFFLPVRIDDPACRLSPTWLDLNFHSIFLSPINARMYIKHALARSDVYCGSYSPDRAAYPLADDRGLGFAWKYVARNVPEHPRGVWTVPWSSVVPFAIDGEGTVRLATRVILERADNSDRVIDIAAAVGREPLTCAFYDRSADATVHPLAAWHWTDGSEVAFDRPREWTAVHTAALIGERPAHDERRTPLPRTPAVSTLYFRATLPEGSVSQVEPVTGAILEWSLQTGQGNVLVSTLALDTNQLAEEQRWLPVTLTIPPHPTEDWTLRLRAMRGDMGPSTPALVTSGLWSARMP